MLKVGGVYIISLLLLIFSGWVMFHTLSYSPDKQGILIAGKAWSDFGGHLPLIRSFSFGSNWPVQNPLFPGEKIRYHFLFYAVAGLLERIGFRIDWAVNFPSIVGFWGMLMMLLILSKKLFNAYSVGLVAIVLLLFNGSLSFIRYFDTHGISVESVKQITEVTSYPSFGPWDGSTIAAIWNLNIFSNQRHLAPGIALALVIIYLINFRRVHPAILGSLVGILMFLNEAIFAGVGIFLIWHFLISPRDRIYLLKSGYYGLPWLMASRLIIESSAKIQYKPGFLLTGLLTWETFARYWFDNLGLHLFLIPIGVLIAPIKAKKLLLPLLTLFAIPNIWQLSVDMFNNHKLFNFIMVIGVLFSALVLVRWSRTILGFLIIPIFVFMIFSGVIDFFAFKNDTYFTASDRPTNPDIEWIYQNVPPESVVLNSTWFYHPASLAGRPIYNGYTYFTWSHGYDSYGREAILKQIYESPTKVLACQLLTSHHIDYVELSDHPESYLHPNFSMWRNEFVSAYNNPTSEITFYDVKESCQIKY
jgi:hypothetical protein